MQKDHRTADIKISKFENGFADGKEVIFYIMEIALGGERWTLKKRYNDFHVLNEQFHESHGNLPLLPTKSFFSLKKAEELETRREGLEKFIQEIAKRLEFYSDPKFIEFIKLAQNRPYSVLKRPEIKHQITHVGMGYRDNYFSPNRKYYFAACSDPSAASRIDSYFSNFSFSWGSKKDESSLTAIGSLECWSKVDPEDDSWAYEKLWVKNLKSQSICLNFSEALRMIAVGCDDGSVVILSLSPDDPKKYSEHYSKQLHEGRVMKLVIDHQRKMMYSIGEDKQLRILNLQTKEVVFKLMVSQEKLTNMAVDLENKTGYIVDAGGSLLVVTLHTTPPMLKQAVKICTGTAIRGFDIDFESGLIYAAGVDTGIIYLYKVLDRTNPETKILKILEFKGTPFVRVMKYCHKTRDLFLGHFNGVISVVNEDIWDHGPLFSGKVHQENVNQIQIMNEGQLVITASNDKSLKVELR